MADNSASSGTRKKVTAVILLGVVAFVIWQAIGLFGGGGSSSTSNTMAAKPQMTANNGQQGPAQPPQVIPKPAELPKAPELTEREKQLMLLQQETEEKYIAAVNELQMLKVQRDIAETNKAIASAKLETVTAEKGIVDALSVQAVNPASYAETLGKGPTTTTTTTNATAPVAPVIEANYTVISVSRIQYKWNAVMGYQGNLYNVSVGDILPADGAKVVSIDRSGVIILRDGQRRKYRWCRLFESV